LVVGHFDRTEFDWLGNPSLTSLEEVVVSIINLIPWLSVLQPPEIEQTCANRDRE
jgi:hypothetical protein